MDYKIDFEERITGAERGEVERVIAKAQNLDELITDWVGPCRSLILCTGEDDNGHHDSVCCILQRNESNLGTFYIPLETIRRHYPDVLPISDYLVGVTRGMYLEFDRRRLDAWDAHLGAAFNDELCSIAIPLDRTAEAALTYAMSEMGEATISVMSPDTWEEWELDDSPLHGSTVLSILCRYQQPTTGLGILESYWAVDVPAQSSETDRRDDIVLCVTRPLALN